MANEVNDGSDQVERISRGDRTSEGTSSDAVISGDRQDHQAMHKEASEKGKDWKTHSDNDDDQSMLAMKPGETKEQYQARLEQRQRQEAEKPKIDSFGIDFGDGTVETAKGKVAKPHTHEFFEAKVQGAMTAFQNLDQQPKYQPDQLIVANMTNPPMIQSDATLPTSETPTEEEVSETKISHGLPNDYDAHTFFESGEALRPAVEAGVDLSGKVIENVIENEKLPIFPYRGLEDAKLAECTKENPRAWDDAARAFPQLTDHLSISQLVPLMKGLVRNEIHYYDEADIKDDNAAKQGKSSGVGTLGYSQISIEGVQKFEQKYPQLKSFLESKGYSGPGHEGKALEDPSCVPMIVAAKLAQIADLYSVSSDKLTLSKKIEITPQSLAYGYNADVYYNPRNHDDPDFHSFTIPKAKELEQLRGYEKAYPTSDERALRKSAHLRHVEQQIREIH